LADFKVDWRSRKFAADCAVRRSQKAAIACIDGEYVMSKQRGAVLVRVTDDALIVANDGRPVSRLGVLALCASDLSEKSDRADEQPEDYPNITDAELLRAIADSSVGVYRADVNRPKRDLRHERGVKADYGGRYLWELLQNADDALADDTAVAAELIGTKGLGFISVLEITDQPEIFSRPFAFRFNKTDTEALLLSRLGKKISAPTFEIPHPAVESLEIAAVLQEGYATAIRLPFRSIESAAKVQGDIERLDPRFLLLLQHVKRLEIEVAGRRSRRIDVSRSITAPYREEIALSTRGTDWVPNIDRWTKWFRHWESEGEDKRLSVAICLPLDGSSLPRALGEHDKPPVHVFFPTDETVGARAIVHASLDVTESRKHFRVSGGNDLVYPQMRELVAEIVAAIPAEAALDAFACIDPRTTTGAARDLASAMLDAVKETPFVPTIGGDKVLPRNVVVWVGKFGSVLRHTAPELKGFCLLDPSVTGRNALLQALQAKVVGTREFFGAMRFCRNSSPNECEEAVEVLLHEGMPALASNPYFGSPEQVPCWWTEAGSARSIDGGILLHGRPRSWPKSIPADALSQETRRHLAALDTALSEDPAAKLKQAIWRERVTKCFVQRGEYLEKALLPAMEAMTPQEWDEHGWEVLHWYKQWSPARNFEDLSGLPILVTSELDESDAFRQRLSRALCLPTDKGWRKAEQCYAGRAWGAPRSFQFYFKDVRDRAVVRPFYAWREPLRAQIDRDAWKGLLRFAGVAWEPKLVALHIWPEGEYANRHLADFNRIEFDLRIEHFPECLAADSRPMPLLETGRTLWASAQKFPARYLAHSKQKAQKLKINFAQHQLQEAEWLPHKKSILYPKEAVAARDAYLAGRGIEGLLPEIALLDIEPRHKNELLRFLRAIGIKSSLPKDGAEWIGWMQRLADASRQGTADKAKLLEVAKTLYRRLFSAAIDNVFPVPGLRVPCYAGGEDCEHLMFVPTERAKWLDQAIFEAPDIRRALLARGYRIFILFLNQADKVDEMLGIGRISKSVSLIPVAAGVDEDGTASASVLYQSRLRALRAAIPERQRSLLVEGLRIEVTSQLSISMRAEDASEIVATDVRAFLNRHGTLMVAGDGAYQRSLGLGLAHYLVGDPRHTAVFESILSAADEDEVIERLRDQGVPAQELQAVHTEMSREKSALQASADNPDADAEEKDGMAQSEGAAGPSRQRSAHSGPQTSASSPGASVTTAPTIIGSTRIAAATKGQAAIRVHRLGTRTWTSRGAGYWDPLAVAEAGRHAEDWFTKGWPQRSPIARSIETNEMPRNAKATSSSGSMRARFTSKSNGLGRCRGTSTGRTSSSRSAVNWAASIASLSCCHRGTNMKWLGSGDLWPSSRTSKGTSSGSGMGGEATNCPTAIGNRRHLPTCSPVASRTEWR
jgi:hypothetical protein